MIKISILYPNHKGARFDLGYYLDVHMPMAIELLSRHSGYRGVSVERGLGGAEPGTDAPHAALCHFQFDSVEQFAAAFAPHAAQIQGDIPKYTDIKPVVQISEMVSLTR